MARTRDAASSIFYAASVRDCACGCGGHGLGDQVLHAAKDAALSALAQSAGHKAKDNRKRQKAR